MVKDSKLTNVLIVEADPILALGLSFSLQQYGYGIAGIAGQAEEADLIFRTNEVDVLLVNTQVPGDMDGCDIAVALMRIKQVPVLYLITEADAGILDRIKQTWPVNFLIKPYDSNHLFLAIEIAIHNFATCGQQGTYPGAIAQAPDTPKRNGHDLADRETILRQGNYIFIKRNFWFVKISLTEILYMEADGNYVHIISRNKKFTIRLSLMQVLQEINSSRFVRINRSAVVNVDAIQSFNKEQVVIDKYEIAIGKNYKEPLFRQLGFR